MAGFKYPYTCPEIDRKIGEARGELISAMSQVFKDYGVKGASFRDAQEAGEELFSVVSDVFEGARQSNENMRTEADKQIKEMDQELIDLRAQLFLANEELKKFKDK